MPSAATAVMLLWALFGHMVLCLALLNRVHGRGIPVAVGKLVWLSAFVIAPGVPLLFAYWFHLRAHALGGPVDLSNLPVAVYPYLAVCCLAAAVSLGHWFQRRGHSTYPPSLRSDRRRVIRVLAAADASKGPDENHHMLVHMPGNETLSLDVAEKGFDIPHLPRSLDRLSILHLSDLHFTGRVAKAYFEQVVSICNTLEPDLIAITGDLVDKPECIDWIPDTLGRLESRCGCFYVLGNHDMRVGVKQLRQALNTAGLTDLGGRWLELSVGQERIVLAGNELPWLPPAADLSDAPPPAAQGGLVRIGLAHSPDQLAWAQRFHIDLLLAGHLHGGQIQVPLIGPIVAPSREGVRFASGTFHDGATVMHVSRGLSGEIPLRLNCPPEVTRLRLHAPGN